MSENKLSGINAFSNRPSLRALQKGAETRQLPPSGVEFGYGSYRTSPCSVKCVCGRNRPAEVSP